MNQIHQLKIVCSFSILFTFTTKFFSDFLLASNPTNTTDSWEATLQDLEKLLFLLLNANEYP